MSEETPSAAVLLALWEQFRIAKLAALDRPTSRNIAVSQAHAQAFISAAQGESRVQ